MGWLPVFLLQRVVSLLVHVLRLVLNAIVASLDTHAHTSLLWLANYGRRVG